MCCQQTSQRTASSTPLSGIATPPQRQQQTSVDIVADSFWQTDVDDSKGEGGYEDMKAIDDYDKEEEL